MGSGEWGLGTGHGALGAKGKDLQQLPLCSSAPSAPLLFQSLVPSPYSLAFNHSFIGARLAAP